MLYSLYEAGFYASTPLRAAARLTRDFWSSPLNPARDSEVGRSLYAGADLFANLTRRYGKPAWGVDSVTIDGCPVRVRAVEEWSSPWCKLTHFARDMSVMGSPIDARLSPTVTNRLAEEKPFAWFQSNMIDTVPAPYPGMGRRVYPGFIQLASFMSMNLEKHQEAHLRYLQQLMDGDGD